MALLVLPFAQPLHEHRRTDRMADDHHRSWHVGQLLFDLLPPLLVGRVVFVWHRGITNLEARPEGTPEAFGQPFVLVVRAAPRALDE